MSARITPFIFNLCIRWKSVVNFMPRLLNPYRKSSRYPPNGSLSVPQNRNECFGEDMNLLSMLAIEPLFLGYPTRDLIIIPTELSRLLGFRWLIVRRKSPVSSYMGAWWLFFFVATCCRTCPTVVCPTDVRSYYRSYTHYNNCWNCITFVDVTVTSEHIIGSSLESFC